jgi:hypothetical protein
LVRFLGNSLRRGASFKRFLGKAFLEEGERGKQFLNWNLSSLTALEHKGNEILPSADKGKPYERRSFRDLARRE